MFTSRFLSLFTAQFLIPNKSSHWTDQSIVHNTLGIASNQGYNYHVNKKLFTSTTNNVPNSPSFIPTNSPAVTITNIDSTTHTSSDDSKLVHPLPLYETDEEIFEIIKKEQKRQINGIELIASENFVSQAVIDALGSCLTNKYSEGLPGARYYGGNEYIDQIERICQTRALSLFNLSDTEWMVNVQPYSGSPANFAAYTALLKPHDRIMGLDLPSGGHLTHGYQTLKRRVSATSIYFESLPYRVNTITGLIDYDEMEKLAELFKPKLLIAGGSAYPRDWDYGRMKAIADSVGALLMADMAHISGIVATGQCANPFEHCDIVTSTTHKSLRGPRSGIIFARKKHEDAINQAVFPCLQGGPHNHQIAAVAVALKEAARPDFQQYIHQVRVNAQTLADALMQKGYKIVTDGTDNHIVLWDVKRTTGLTGAKLEKLYERLDISVNKNSVVGDTSALNPGGIRLGTPAMTTRGLRQHHMVQIAEFLQMGVQLALKIENSLHSADGPDTAVSRGPSKLINFLNALDQSEEFKKEIIDLKEKINQFSKLFSYPSIRY